MLQLPSSGGVLPNHPPRNLTIATTGASGAIFLRQLLLAVARDEHIETVNFIASDSALRVMAEELDIEGRSNLVERILGASKTQANKIQAQKIKEQSNADIGANVASGSYPADAGATIFPLIPAFYYGPASLDEMAREFAYRVLAHLGLPQADAFRWKG